MPSQSTIDALTKIANWLRPGTNEGITFTIARLTIDLFGDSFLGGGDLSRYTPGGARGTAHSQLSTATFLDGGGGSPSTSPLDVTFRLNTGRVTVGCTPPSAPPTTDTFSVDYAGTISDSTGKSLVFHSDRARGRAAFTLALLLL